MRPIVFQDSFSEDEEESSSSSLSTSTSEELINQSRSQYFEVQCQLHSTENSKTFLVRSTSNMESVNQGALLQISNTNEEQQSRLAQSDESNADSHLKVVKVFDHSNIRSLSKLQNELATLKLVGKNVNFLRCLGASMSKEPLIFADTNNQVYEYPAGHSLLLFDFCSNSNLLEHVQESQDGNSGHFDIRTVFLKLVKGLRFLHKETKMAHLNLMASKILLDKDLNPKISDLSFSKVLNKLTREDIRISKHESEKIYCAPELITPSSNQPLQGEKIDVFALGVMLYVTLFREAPFRSASPQDPFYKFLCKNTSKDAEFFFRVHKKAHINADLKQLICQMLQNDPNLRPSTDQILENPWFKVNNKIQP